MPLYDWGSEFSVGVKLFDEQHKKLIDAVNGLSVAMKERKAVNALRDLFDKLVDYAANHFEAEEKLMLKHKYPEYDNHKSEHIQFKMKLIEFQYKFKHKNAGISVELFTFLMYWIKSHVKGTDMKYTAFFKSKGVN